MFEQFTIIRPFALWLIPLVWLAVIVWYRRQQRSNNDWMDPQLADYMLQQQTVSSAGWLPTLAAILASLLAVAIAGPSWQKIPVPVEKNPDALVIILDMSLSMNAQDLKPSRAIRAKQKAIDIIRQRQDGQTAIIAYSGLAHTVSPFTDDVQTIEHLISSLSPDIMPKLGSRPDKAIVLAEQISTAAGLQYAQLLLISDGVNDRDIGRLEKVIKPNLPLAILAVGSAEGSPVQLADNSFLKDQRGNIVLPKLELEPLRKLQKTLDIDWTPMGYDDNDWRPLLAATQQQILLLNQPNSTATANDLSELRFDQWQDHGHWLAILVLPLFIYLFRRGALLSLMISIGLSALLPIHDSEASEVQANASEPTWLQSLLSTDDQLASHFLASDPQRAAELFERPDWKAQAHYQAQQYEQAEALFKQDQSAEGRYNLGNSQARQGKYQEAIKSYQQALDLRPDFEAATKNKALLEQLLDYQPPPEQSSSNQSSSDQTQSNQNESKQSDSEPSQSDQSQADSSNSSSSNDSSPKDGSPKDGSSNSDTPSLGNDGDTSDNKQQIAEQQSSSIDDISRDAELGSTSESKSESAVQQAQSEALAQAQATQTQTDQQNDPDNQDQQRIQAASALDREQQAARQNYLNQVEDQPGILLQRKFLYQYRQSEQQQDEDIQW